MTSTTNNKVLEIPETPQPPLRRRMDTFPSQETKDSQEPDSFVQHITKRSIPDYFKSALRKSGAKLSPGKQPGSRKTLGAEAKEASSGSDQGDAGVCTANAELGSSPKASSPSKSLDVAGAAVKALEVLIKTEEMAATRHREAADELRLWCETLRAGFA